MSDEQPACRCGCGETPSPGSTWPPGGHDHRALLQRVALIGNTAEFCDWFDETFQTGDGQTSRVIDLIRDHNAAMTRDLGQVLDVEAGLAEVLATNPADLDRTTEQ